MHPMPEMPLKWLLRTLKETMDDYLFAELMIGYKVVEERYKLTAKLRHEQSTLRSFQRAQRAYADGTERWRHYAIRIQGKESRIKRLEEKLQELENIS